MTLSDFILLSLSVRLSRISNCFFDFFFCLFCLFLFPLAGVSPVRPSQRCKWYHPAPSYLKTLDNPPWVSKALYKDDLNLVTFSTTICIAR